MTPQEAKELLPIIEAYANGETIQISSARGWVDLAVKPLFNGKPQEYRIKPKPRRVEMTHEDLPPVFWVQRKGKTSYHLVTSFDPEGDIWIGGQPIIKHQMSEWLWSPDRKTWQDFTKEVAE